MEQQHQHLVGRGDGAPGGFAGDDVGQVVAQVELQQAVADEPWPVGQPVLDGQSRGQAGARSARPVRCRSASTTRPDNFLKLRALRNFQTSRKPGGWQSLRPIHPCQARPNAAPGVAR